jgi:hypothetical protein
MRRLIWTSRFTGRATATRWPLGRLIAPALLGALLLAVSARAAEPAARANRSGPPRGIELTRLQPDRAEFGTLPYPEESLRADVQPRGSGPGMFDTAIWYSGNQFWPDARKIVQVLPTTLPEPGAYRSSMTNLFMVTGGARTGVGLWVQVTMMYHQLDYAIPRGARTFTALAFTTDDSHGYMPDWANYSGWQDCTLTVLVDGKVAQEIAWNKVSVPMGAGALVGEIEVPLSLSAKTLTIRLQASPAIDWNKNVEVVIAEGAFSASRGPAR